MNDRPEYPTPLILARQAAKRQVEERDRLISYMAARGIHQLEQYLREGGAS